MQAAVVASHTTRAACPPARRATRPSRHSSIVFAAARDAQQARTEAAPPSAARPPLLERLRAAAGAVALSAALALAPVTTGALEAHAQATVVSNETPVLDLARVVPAGQLEGLQQQLKDLERETGWRVRMLTRYGPSAEPSVDELRAGWNVDDRTIVVLVDPTSPNILNFKFGREVRSVLRPAFFSELQSRYGSIFYVRDQGESASVMNAMDALTGCLAKNGCFVVPGLSMDHYAFTLVLSIAGGVVAGSASKLEPTGFVQRRWVWVLIFAPLWGTLFINFGLGPVVTRTPDLLPVLGNLAGFVVAATVVGFSPQVAKAVGLSVDESDAP